MKLLIVKEGVVVGEMSVNNLPDVSSAGRDWIVVEAMSEIDALYQAGAYDSRKHPRASELEKAHRHVRESGMCSEDAVNYLMDKLYSPLDPESISIKLEDRGHTTFRAPGYKPKTWVAEIVNKHPLYKFEREFLKPTIDYSHADRRAYRGVMYNYTLETGKVYEISENAYRYYCRVVNKELITVTQEEVGAWLNDRLA